MWGMCPSTPTRSQAGLAVSNIPEIYWMVDTMDEGTIKTQEP
jgi:hypothetical protein